MLSVTLCWVKLCSESKNYSRRSVPVSTDTCARREGLVLLLGQMGIFTVFSSSVLPGHLLLPFRLTSGQRVTAGLHAQPSLA